MEKLSAGNLQFGGVDLAFLLLGALLAGAVMWQVLSLKERLGPGRTAVLTLLRLTALAALLGLYLEPSLRREKKIPYRPVVAVAVDTSRSMGLGDREGSSRLEKVRILLESGAFAEIASNYYPEYYSFSTAATSFEREDVGRLVPAGDWTDLENSLDSLVKGAPSSLGAVILFTDGGHTDPSPAQMEGETAFPVPLVAVGVGDDTVFKDLEIESVNYAEMAFAGRPVTFNVSLRSRGYGGSKVPLLLKEGSRAVLSRVVPFSGEEEEKEVDVEWTPAKPGIYHLSFEIPVQGGEDVGENNVQRVTLEVARDKIRVLYVGGRPSWTHRFLRDALKGDPTVDLVTFIILRSIMDAITAPQDELSLIPFPTRKIFLEELHNFDIVIFDDFSSRMYFPRQYLERVRDFVGEGGAFWMIGGPLSFGQGGYAGSPLAEVLPVTFEGASIERNWIPEKFKGEVTPTGRRHPLFGGLGDMNPDELPGLEGYNDSGPARPGAVTLVAHGTDKDQPVIVVGKYGEGRTMAVLTDSLWKWNFEMVGRGKGNFFFLSMVRRAVRWSVGDRLMEPVTIGLEKDYFLPGEKLHGTVRVLGEDYLPDENRNLRVTIRGEGEKIRTIPASEESPGVYRVVAPVLPPGTYELVAEAMEEGRVRSEDRRVFNVSWPSSEFHAPGLNRSALERLVSGSPGGIVRMGEVEPTARQLGALLAEVAPPYRVEVSERRNAAETVAAFLFLLVLLAVEWAVRKKYGLD